MGGGSEELRPVNWSGALGGCAPSLCEGPQAAGRAGGYEVKVGSSSRPSRRRERTESKCPWVQSTLSASWGQEDREPGDAARKFGGHRVRCSAVGFALWALGKHGTGARLEGLIEK